MFERVVLVTGASGFIGRHLVGRLREAGARVWGVSHSAVDVCVAGQNLVADVADSRQMHEVYAQIQKTEGRPVEFVFHLAGEKSLVVAKEQYYETLETSFLGALNLLHEANGALPHPRVLLVSSMAVYDPAGRGPLEESAPVCSRSIYAWTKLAQENLGMAFYHDFGVPVTVARLANVFGSGQSEVAVIPSLVRQVLETGHANAGNLDSIRDFVYVEDVVEALMTLVAHEAAAGQVFNVGTGRGTSVRQVAEIVTRLCGVSSSVKSEPERQRAGDQRSLVPDVARIHQVTGWKPKFDLEAGLRRMVDELRTH